jgi:hypothetical protein
VIWEWARWEPPSGAPVAAAEGGVGAVGAVGEGIGMFAAAKDARGIITAVSGITGGHAHALAWESL